MLTDLFTGEKKKRIEEVEGDWGNLAGTQQGSECTMCLWDHGGKGRSASLSFRVFLPEFLLLLLVLSQPLPSDPTVCSQWTLMDDSAFSEMCVDSFRHIFRFMLFGIDFCILFHLPSFNHLFRHSLNARVLFSAKLQTFFPMILINDRGGRTLNISEPVEFKGDEVRLMNLTTT